MSNMILNYYIIHFELNKEERTGQVIIVWKIINLQALLKYAQ